MTKNYALITGASSGLGYDFAYHLAEKGYHLVLVARSQDKLDALAHEIQEKHAVKTVVIAKDLSAPHAAKGLYDELKNKDLTLDILINNAGFAGHGPFVVSDLKWEMDMVHVNIIALMELTKYVLQDMVLRKTGRIMNVASTAGFLPGPLMAVYYASKAFVLNFSEALHKELKGTGVTVTALCPGATRTNFEKTADVSGTLLFKMSAASSKSVVKYGYKAMMRGKAVAIHGIMNRVMMFSLRFTPRSWATAISYRVVKKTDPIS